MGLPVALDQPASEEQDQRQGGKAEHQADGKFAPLVHRGLPVDFSKRIQHTGAVTVESAARLA